MRERFQKLVVVVGLVLVIGGGWWYLTQGKEISKQWNQLLPGGKQKEEILKLQPSENLTPIDKLVSANEEGIVYKLKVELAEPWERQEQGEYQLLRGGVTLKDDPLKRIIQIQVGMLDGSVYIGEYPEGWEGKGYYQVKPQSELERKVGLGDEMWLEYKLSVGSDQANAAFTLSITKVLDGLAEEYRSGEYMMTIPTEFLINTEKVGVLTK